MFKPHIGNCIDCEKGSKSFIVVKAMRCHKHNEEFKQSKKSPARLERERLSLEKKKSKPNPFNARPRKVTGEKDIFNHIWDTRLHRCEVCDRPIIRKKDEVGMFSHVASKGSNVVLRLEEDFILLMGDGKYPNCNCHPRWEKRTDEMLQIEMWKPIFLLLDEAKKRAHELRKNKPLFTEEKNQ